MFEPGDKVVHTRHGAGIVLETKTLVFDGEERIYFCVQMNDDRRTLMIPMENVDEDELRPAITDMSVIEDVLFNEPADLPDNHRTRQSDIRTKLKTRNPRKLAQALRDLIYLERTHRLTNTDAKLRDKVMQALTRELALRPSITVATARQNLQKLVDRAMHEHIDEEEEVTTS